MLFVIDNYYDISYNSYISHKRLCCSVSHLEILISIPEFQMRFFLLIVMFTPETLLTNCSGLGDCHKFYINVPFVTISHLYNYHESELKLKQRETQSNIKFIHSNVQHLFFYEYKAEKLNFTATWKINSFIPTEVQILS